MNINPIRQILQEKGKGIPSYCTANGLAIRALLEQAKRFDAPVLLEATANQVNQFGGYTGMQPADYRNYVHSIAGEAGFPRERILLGGDHLGPLTWAGEPEESAMAKAEELVRLFVLAGYTKIHLDTSMRLADDPKDIPLRDETIAKRGARLYKACDEAYARLLEREPDAVHPVYIIGSEVPIPGGATQAEEGVSVTGPSALQNTMAVYRQVFEAQGLADAFRHIVGVVVQPGVEFGDDEVHHYRRAAAAALCEKARQLGVTLEGHSTDYQSPQHLREMCEDGIAILKVGPAVTFALREGLFALGFMEEYLLPREERADFMGTLERAMLESPANWNRHYHGTPAQLALKRRFSFSDRCRYYLALPEVQRAVDKLLDNLRGVHIPLSMLHQYMPIQYARVRDGLLPCEPEALLFDCVREMAEDYNYAAGYLPVR